MSFNAVIKAKSTPEANLIFDWLDENVEDGTYCYNGRDILSRELSFKFDIETDRILFLLRWA